MASFIAQPATDPLQSRPEPQRLGLHDGALVTEADFAAEQLYFRGQLSRLALHLHGAGTIAGLNVSFDPASGEEAEIRVDPGLAVDRMGRIVELPREGCLTISPWMRQQNDDPIKRAHLLTGLRSAGGGLPEHVVADVYLGFHACARVPSPAFADPNAETIDGIQPSRILDGAKLDLVVRPEGDDRQPQSLPASQLVSPVSAQDLQAYKRAGAWGLTQPESDPFAMPAGGMISEHVMAGNRQNGSEVLLARLILPVVTGNPDNPILFDETIDLSQAVFAPSNHIRQYSYSAEELALLALDLRR